MECPPESVTQPYWIEIGEISPKPGTRKPHYEWARYETLYVQITDKQAGALHRLARLMVEAGLPDGPWQAGRQGRVAMFGRSLHRLAKWSLSEGDKEGLYMRRYKPRPVMLNDKAREASDVL